jgi:hypothetical protein
MINEYKILAPHIEKDMGHLDLPEGNEAISVFALVLVNLQKDLGCKIV